MMKNYRIIYLVIIGLMSCDSQLIQHDNSEKITPKKTTTTKINKVKYSKKIFSIKNEDFSSFGYKIWDEDEDIGVKSICLDGDFIYLTDVFHNNVKKINLNTWEVEVSKEIKISNIASDRSCWLRDIVIFNEKIYITSDEGYLFILNKELEIEDQILIGGRNRSYVYSKSIKRLEIYSNESHQNENSSVSFNIVGVDNSEEIFNEERTIGVSEYTKWLNNNYSKGKEYKEVIEDGKHFFKSKEINLELQEALPHISEYDAFNIDFNETRLVYFESFPDSFIVHSYLIIQ